MCMGGAPKPPPPQPPPPPPSKVAEVAGGQKAPRRPKAKKRSLKRAVTRASGAGVQLGTGGLRPVSPTLDQ